MSDLYVLDDKGEPVREPDVRKWGEFLEKKGVRVVGLDSSGDVRVSTVFLGLDHGWGEGPPVLWETMIFGGPHDQFQDRYTSREAALAGHKAACELAGVGR